MKVVLASEPDHVGEWAFPGTWPDFTTPAEDAFETELIGRSAFRDLWRVLDPSESGEQALIEQCLPAGGYPHRGPERYDVVNPALIQQLLAIPAHERWRLARDWARALSGQEPSKERLSSFKALTRSLCALAGRMGERDLVLLPLR